ncbi:MAG: hypothetical protein AB8B59_00865, partial [Maribacter sp.]
MKIETKQIKLLFTSLFCMIFGVVSAHNILEIVSFGDETKHFTVTDSTTSKKKPKKVKNVEADKIELDSKYFVRNTSLRKDVSKFDRNEEGNSVSTNSYAINDRLEPNAITNVVSFNIYDKKLNTHSFSGTQSSMFPLNFTSENNVNTKRELFGFEYRFNRPKDKKFRYSARARLERDNESQTYYQLGIGARLKGKKRRNLLGLEYFPVRSGPGHILKIYRAQFSNYNEFQLTKNLKQIASLEGSFYTDKHGDFTLLSRTEYLLFESSLFKISPLIEAAYGRGSIDRRDSYPYWMAEKRVYGGGGIVFGIGSDKNAFQMIADASIFSEVGQPNFERYTGALS